MKSVRSRRPQMAAAPHLERTATIAPVFPPMPRGIPTFSRAGGASDRGLRALKLTAFALIGRRTRKVACLANAVHLRPRKGL